MAHKTATVSTPRRRHSAAACSAMRSASRYGSLSARRAQRKSASSTQQACYAPPGALEARSDEAIHTRAHTGRSRPKGAPVAGTCPNRVSQRYRSRSLHGGLGLHGCEIKQLQPTDLVLLACRPASLAICKRRLLQRVAPTARTISHGPLATVSCRQGSSLSAMGSHVRHRPCGPAPHRRVGPHRALLLL